jgi:hypothetical protein
LLRYYGNAGVMEMRRRHRAFGERVAAAVDANPRFERTAPVYFGPVCFRYKGSDEENQKLLDAGKPGGKPGTLP